MSTEVRKKAESKNRVISDANFDVYELRRYAMGLGDCRIVLNSSKQKVLAGHDLGKEIVKSRRWCINVKSKAV